MSYITTFLRNMDLNRIIVILINVQRKFYYDKQNFIMDLIKYYW